MVTQQSTVFAAVADPTRRDILDSLRARERSAGEIAARFPVSRPAVSRHLRVLREAGLVHERRESRLRLYSLRPERLREIEQWIAQYRVFWSVRLQELKRLAETTK
jgi:DNA-binding transcriptional ArsR family regulator